MKKFILLFALLSLGANAAVYNLSGKVVETTREIIQLDGKYVYRDSMRPVFDSAFCDSIETPAFNFAPITIKPQLCKGRQ